MADEAWIDAAQNYNCMNDRARAEYWNQLTPEQQDALRNALASSQSNSSASAPARRGCSSPLAAGCIGLILGCVLTIGVEVVAVMMGAQAVVGLLGGLSGGSSSGTTSGRNQPTNSTAEPGDNVMSPNDQLLSYCGTAREFNDSNVAAACANERRNQKLREETTKNEGEN